MYKIDRRGGGGVQKSFSRTDPNNDDSLFKFNKFLIYIAASAM